MSRGPVDVAIKILQTVADQYDAVVGRAEGTRGRTAEWTDECPPAVSGASTSESVELPDPGLSPLTQVTEVFPWVVSSGEPEGLTLTREILADPNALAEITAARRDRPR
jgi:hypothetical protein